MKNTRLIALVAIVILVFVSGECLAITVGDYVRCHTNVRSRTGPGKEYSEISSSYYSPISQGGYGVNPGSVGHVTDGPMTANGYTWWKVTWGQSPITYSGWSAESSEGTTYLVSVNTETRPCGVDVSSNQGTINWQTVINTGHKFAFVRSSLGDDRQPQLIDSQFENNMVNGRAAGVLVGAYHVGYPAVNDATREANFFISVARNYITDGYLRPALDLEEATPTSGDYSTWVDTWIQTVKSQTGVEPIIYTTPSYANAHLTTSLTKYRLWIANWLGSINTQPTTSPWSTWDFWQYNGDNPAELNDEAMVPGIAAKVDTDVFNGTLANLTSQFVIGQAQDTTPPTISDFSVEPSSVTLGDSFTISYTVSDTGGSGLKQVELWRSDGDGSESDPKWQQVGPPNSHSGNGPVSGSFSDAPPSVGTYWYGLHVLDNASPLSNITTERQAGLGPLQRVVNLAAPTLVRIEVTGSTQVNENSGAQYTCTAYYSDGSTSNVTNSASWSQNSPYATISSTGYLTTSSVTSDQLCTITATYSGYSDTHDVTIKDVPASEDTTPPTVAITSPSSGQTFTSSPITVSGTASDPGSPSSGVALVEVRVNGGTWQTASGTTSWNRSVSLTSGSNTIEARSRDNAGNYSTIASVTVTYNPPEPPPDEFWKSPTATGKVSPDAEGWTNAEYAYGSDNQYATKEGGWRWQYWTGFNFDIPAGSIIKGIEAEFDIYSDNPDVKRFYGYVYKGDNFNGKTDSINNPNYIWITGSEATYTKGGSDDLWNQEWTADDFSGNNFRVVVSGDVPTLYLDQIRVRVYYESPPPTGSLRVTISPQGAIDAGAQWNVDGGAWQNSGDTVSGLSVGSHTVNYKAVTGWTAPPSEQVDINSGQTTTITRNYTPQTGNLQVTLAPAEAVSGGAQWNVDAGAWQNSGDTVTGLSLGSHTVNYKAVTGWTAPPSEQVNIDSGQTTSISRNYTQQTGNLQVTLAPAEAVSAGAQWNVDGGAWQNSGDTITGLSVGPHTVNYKAVPGWTAPPSEQVDINSGQTTYVTRTYSQQQPSVEFATTSSSGTESVSPAILAVNLSGASGQTVTVDYSVTGGTTTGGGVDYTLASGTLTFSPGDTTGNVQITIVDDSSEERDETIIVALSNPVNARLGTNVSHTYTIVDNDGGPPQSSAHIPEPNSIQAARDTIIQLHITDGDSGVAYSGGTVTIQVEGELIYDGANENPEGVYDSRGSSQAVKGVCRRSGTPADYSFVFQPSTLFDYEQKVDVAVSATDKVGNSMSETYYFYTVMRQFGKNVKVNSDTGTLMQDRPATAADSAGNIWVVWEQTNAAGDTDIYVGKLQADSNGFGSSVQVAGGADHQHDPAIAIDNADTIYVVWQGDDVSRKWDIFVSTSVNGTSWSSPVKVNGSDPNNESDQTCPAIAIDGNNRAYVVWEDNRAGNKDIWVATSTDRTTWTNTQVTTHTSDQSEPAVAIDSDNVAYIVWTDARNLGTAGTDVYGAASDQGPWTNVAIVTTASNQSSPAIAGESSGGGLHLVWVDDASGSADVFYAATTDGFDTTPVTGASIIDEPDTIQAAPSIAVSGTSNTAKVFACWQDARNVVDNNGDIDIYFAESGSNFGTNILVNDDVGTNAQTYPVIGIDQNGSPYVACVDNRSGNKDIYYAGATAIGPALPTTSTTIGGKTVVELNGANTGYVDDARDVLVEIPGGATPSNISVTISETRNLPELPSGAFGVCYDFGPSGLQFSAPVTITIPHAANDCPGLPIYSVYWYNTQIGAWSTTGVSNVRHLDNTAPNVAPGIHAVQFDVTHFTTFGASASTTPPSGGGGGGGGCSVCPQGQGSTAEFVLPYAALVTVLLLLSWMDSRRRRTL